MIAVVVIGAAIPQSSLNHALGFATLPPAFFAVLVGFVAAYLVAVEIAKYFFFKIQRTTTSASLQRDRLHRIHRIAARWSHHQPLPRTSL